MKPPPGARPALYWEPMDKGRVRCRLCPFNCVLSECKTGICAGKTNVGGILYAVNYAFTTSINLDPMEKKPLYHFYPGSSILSIGPNGCNMACDFCQNYYISQQSAPTERLMPEEAAALAVSYGSVGLAYTYAEPLIWYEYVLDTSKEVRKAGLKNVLVTNGMINPEPMMELLPYTDAMNIDIKSMDPAFYRKVCHGMLEPVLETVKLTFARTHVEITNLVIPGFNDSDEMFHQLTDFLADLSPYIPLHFSRYHPDYKLHAPPTPLDTLLRAARIASEKLKYVYIGNVHTDTHNQTKCPFCGKIVIERGGFSVYRVSLTKGKCNFCGGDTGVIM
ncbi:MAG: AmmeMemoRadiSam system radical SAM enzyme [Nitrospinae bacterium]|nr:AmmeMemoRadiSam system radical SAM enzyme [Nitrospinota bacterium]